MTYMEQESDMGNRHEYYIKIQICQSCINIIVNCIMLYTCFKE